MLVGSFFHEDAKYSLHFSNGEFSLLMRPSMDSIQKKHGMYASFYFDDETTDDVGEIKNPFIVINQSVKMMARYIFDERLNYFYFKSSTERKDKIYPWIGKKLIVELAQYKKQFEFVWHEERFDFWQKLKNCPI